jgi:hypothetical protein
MELGEILEIIDLIAISIELLALFIHTKIDHKLDEHIKEVNKHLEKSDELIKILDEHVVAFDGHISKLEAQE